MESRNRNSLNSAVPQRFIQSDSEIKNSSSNMQDRSEVLSSEQSKNESDVDS